jgi:hypothetical protein
MVGTAQARLCPPYKVLPRLPDGQITLRAHALICPPCPAPPEKNILVFRNANHRYICPVLSHQEGRWPTSLTRGRMRWTRMALLTRAPEADGEDVWSWHLDAGVKFLRSKLLRGDGGQRARAPGRARYTLLKPLRGECRVIPVYPTNACALYHYHCTRGYRAHRAPGIPCALNSERAGINEYLAKKAFGEIAKPCPAVIARSTLVRRSPPSGEGGCDEAIHSSLAAFAAPWIASLALAMTWLGYLKIESVRFVARERVIYNSSSRPPSRDP